MRIWGKKDQWKTQTMARGPVQRLGQLMEKWGWQWTEPFRIMMPGDRPLQLLRDSTKWIVERAKKACKE